MWTISRGWVINKKFSNHSPHLVGCDADKIIRFNENYKSLPFNLGHPGSKNDYYEQIIKLLNIKLLNKR